MDLPDRHLLMGMTLGAICATALSAIGPGVVFADEPAGGAIDPNALVRFGERTFDVRYEDWVDTEVISRSAVKKIGYGRTSHVDITTTSTGTYSTDGLVSPHIEYPGIEVEEVGDGKPFGIMLLGSGYGWFIAPLSRGNSFLHLRTPDGHQVFSDGTTTCLDSRDYTVWPLLLPV